MRALLGSLLATLAALPALAQPSPPTLPVRDVSVVYRLDGAARNAVPGGLPETTKLLWDAAGRRLRVEPQGRGQVLLVDLAVPQAELIEPGLHGVIKLPMRPKDVEPITLADARLTRRGSAVIAGLRCTEYDVAARRGHGVVCLTRDGVALRGSGDVDGKQGSFVALSVTPGPLPASSFEVPAGYMQLTMPNLSQFR
ncbi:MAG: hypothetical protein RQ966_04955 [Acetobacteraceae bacterium]|nr:hypothetical protein [Acetobacteraceae bacterium]